MIRDLNWQSFVSLLYQIGTWTYDEDSPKYWSQSSLTLPLSRLIFKLFSMDFHKNFFLTADGEKLERKLWLAGNMDLSPCITASIRMFDRDKLWGDKEVVTTRGK